MTNLVLEDFSTEAAASLGRSLKQLPSLRCIALHFAGSDNTAGAVDFIATALAANTVLADLAVTAPVPQQVMPLLQTLLVPSAAPALHIVRWSSLFGDDLHDALAAFAPVLGAATKLRELHLSVPLGDAGFRLLAPQFGRLTALELLDLEVQLSELSVGELVSQLAKLPTLRELCVRDKLEDVHGFAAAQLSRLTQVEVLLR